MRTNPTLMTLHRPMFSWSTKGLARSTRRPEKRAPDLCARVVAPAAGKARPAQEQASVRAGRWPPRRCVGSCCWSERWSSQSACATRYRTRSLLQVIRSRAPSAPGRGPAAPGAARQRRPKSPTRARSAFGTRARRGCLGPQQRLAVEDVELERGRAAHVEKSATSAPSFCQGLLARRPSRAAPGRAPSRARPWSGRPWPPTGAPLSARCGPCPRRAKSCWRRVALPPPIGRGGQVALVVDAKAHQPRRPLGPRARDVLPARSCTPSQKVLGDLAGDARPRSRRRCHTWARG